MHAAPRALSACVQPMHAAPARLSVGYLQLLQLRQTAHCRHICIPHRAAPPQVEQAELAAARQAGRQGKGCSGARDEGSA